jgi:hypothetical protein
MLDQCGQLLRAALKPERARQHDHNIASPESAHPDFTQELPRKLLPTRAKKSQNLGRRKR